MKIVEKWSAWFLWIVMKIEKTNNSQIFLALDNESVTSDWFFADSLILIW